MRRKVVSLLLMLSMLACPLTFLKGPTPARAAEYRNVYEAYQVPDLINEVNEWAKQNSITIGSDKYDVELGKRIVQEIDNEMRFLYPNIVNTSDYFSSKAWQYGAIRYSWLASNFKKTNTTYKRPVLTCPVIYEPNSGFKVMPNPNTGSIGTIALNYAGNGTTQNVPVWGKDAAGSWYIDWSCDYAYRFGVGWSGYRYNGNFWDNSTSREVVTYNAALTTLKNYGGNIPDTTFESFDFPFSGLLDMLIQEGVDTYWAGIKGSQMDYRNWGEYEKRKNGTIHNLGEKPKGGWVDKILIIIPPTYISWGYGLRFNRDSNSPNTIYRIDIPIAPINKILTDIYADFSAISPESAATGKRVTLTVTVGSTFNESTTTNFLWTVKGDPSNVTYSNGSSGNITIGALGTKQMSISFDMPANGVEVTCEVNPANSSGKRAIEENGNYENNKAVHFISTDGTTTTTNTYEIPPWVLTQKVAFSLTSTASLSLPRDTVYRSYSWTNNKKAWGSLGVYEETAIYNNFAVSNNLALDMDNSITANDTFFTRFPKITGRVDRDNSGIDDPQNGIWAKNNVSLTQSGKITSYGTASKYYDYKTWYQNDDGNWRSTSHTNNITSTDFSPINDVRTYTFKVYNGMENLPFKKDYDIGVTKSDIKDNGLAYTFTWEGTAINFDVIRWMCHRNADNSEYGWTSVGGQYERTFIGQSTGSLTWKSDTSQATAYAADRAAARDGKTGQGNYTYGVFATDKSLQSIAWPIKSGYSFNPVGVYTCTVRTSQYKETIDPTEEHEELVEKVKTSFRYSSELQYFTSSRDKTLTNVSDDNRRGVLSISGDDKTTLTATQLATTKDRTGGTVDALLAQVMEGYSESGTSESNVAYKYQERTDKKIYLVVEETVITFKLAPTTAGRIYTDVNMPNGDYRVRVWQEKFDFVGPYEKKANLTMQNSGNFDGLVVTVRGSMYDDR